MSKVGRAWEIAFTPELPMRLVLGAMVLWSLVQFLFVEPQNVFVAILTTLGSLCFILGLKLLASISFEILVVGDKGNVPRGTMFLLAILCAFVGTVLSLPFLILNAPQ